MARAAGRLVTQQQLINEVWGPQVVVDGNHLRVHVAAIRRKIEEVPGLRHQRSEKEERRKP
jgi:two-component system KDP operon response regulator KdpE